jgi:hypothetical protein
MRVPLDEHWTGKLLDLPESGMGYQRVRVRLRNGRVVENAIALNAGFLEVPDDAPDFNPADIVDVEPTAPTQ